MSQRKERKPNAEKTLDNWQSVPLEASRVVITACGQGIYRGSGKTPRETNRETIAWSSRWAGNRLDSRDPQCEDVATREASRMAPRHPRLSCGLFLPYGFLLLSLLFSSLSCSGLICSSPSSFLKGNNCITEFETFLSFPLQTKTTGRPPPLLRRHLASFGTLNFRDGSVWCLRFPL